MTNNTEKETTKATYNPSDIEAKWQKYWAEHKTFKTLDTTEKPKYYILDMFPYPSGSGLHVGHVEGYTATDILSRYKRAKGFNVMHPMGWDAFGLPAEQYAIKTGTHPKITTEKNIAIFKEQLQSLGFSYDWDREINTSQPDYYKWTQFLFSKLYEKGLAFVDDVPVNWCPELGTVLSNEEVIDGKSERGGFPVIRKPMRQWMLRITEYAERLLEDLELLDWPDSLKEMQRNWIGKSIGAEIEFDVVGHDEQISVFTTRSDTLFGATYMVLAPEHRLVDIITTDEYADQVAAYREEAARKSDLARTDLSFEKTGVFTGCYAINPVNGQEIPIWIADYVLASYGTGAVMAVPAHDERDQEFAKVFELPIVHVVRGKDGETVCEEDGILFNSEFLDGLSVDEAKTKMIEWLESNGKGRGRVQYKLRDWLFSRQRYWGEPFPLVHTEDGKHHLICADELPLELPELPNYLPTGSGEPPLARATEWVETTFNGSPARRETNTMPQWAGSCWYYLRYLDPHNNERPWDPEKEAYWMNVDVYVGGAEHAVLHLLYARFWHKVLYDCGLVTTKEPFQRIVNQGMILGLSYEYYEMPDGTLVSYLDKEADPKKYADALPRTIHTNDVVYKDGKPVHPTAGFELKELTEKMSKSRGNVINPNDVISEFGADALRIYEMFMGPLEQMKPWNTTGVSGSYRFLSRVWRLVVDEDTNSLNSAIVDGEPDNDLNRELHQTIKKVTLDTEEMRYNTAIARLMEFTNYLYKCDTLPRIAIETLVQLLAPYAPHLSEELWSRLLVARGENVESISYHPWPTWDESALVASSYELPVQVMGKLRATIDVPTDVDQETAVEIAKAHPNVASFLEGKTIRKVIFVPNRILNFVAN